MIKLVVSDMDGTLLDHHSQISDKNVEAIRKLEKNNIEFAIASGRDFQGVHSILDHYGITCEAILGNGAQYCDKDGHILMSCYLDKSVYSDIVNIYEEAHIPYMVFTTAGFFTGQDEKWVRDQFVERTVRRFDYQYEDYIGNGKHASSPCNHLQHYESIDEFLKMDLEIIKVEAFSLDKNEIIFAKEQLQNIPTISFLSSFDDNVEVTDEKAQKGYILENVIQLKNIKKEEVVVLGDGMNDITLFQCFPYSYAPSNAEKEIQSLAYHIVSHCDQDGFAEAVESLLKI